MADDDYRSHPREDWRPDPDPTRLTTAQLRQAIEDQNRYFGSQIAGLKEVLIEKIDGLQKIQDVKIAAAERLVENQQRASAEAIKKAEDSTTEKVAAVIAQLSYVKEALVAAEARLAGSQSSRTQLISIVMVAIAIIGSVLGVLAFQRGTSTDAKASATPPAVIIQVPEGSRPRVVE